MTRMSLTLLGTAAAVLFLVSRVFGYDAPRGSFFDDLNNPTCYGSRYAKVMLNQTGYIQYIEYMQDIPNLSSFFTCYWINLLDIDRRSTTLNYGHPGHFDKNALTIQFTGRQRPSWTIYVNDKLVCDVPAPVPKKNTWFHMCHSWNGEDGKWSTFYNGRLLGHGYAAQTIGEVIRGGGQMVSGQHQNTLHDGMDRREGVEGWITLLHLHSRPLPRPENPHIGAAIKRLSQDCRALDRGDVLGWLRTPRKGYGGKAEFPARERCGYF